MKKNLDIIYTSDVHGHVFPVNYATGLPEDSGLLNMASQIRKDGNTLVLDGGDSLQGTPLSSYYLDHSSDYAYHPVAVGFNAVGCDYFTLGNHDFNFGYDVIRHYLDSMNGTCLCANLTDLRGELPVLSDTVHVMENGLRVGLTGIVTDYVNIWEQPGNLTELRISDPFEAARTAYEHLKDTCDICICMYHGGFEEDLETGVLLSDSQENIACRLARELNFDLLLTGHQHMPVKGVSLCGTYAVQPPANAGQYIQIKMECQADELGAVIADITSSLEKTESLHCNEPYQKLLSVEHDTQRWLDMPIGRLLVPILPEQKLNAALCGSQVAALFNQVQLEATGADFSCTSLGNDPVGLTADVTMREICGAYLFANTLVILEVDREVIRASLERCASYFSVEDGNVKIADEFLKPKVEHYNYDFYAGLQYEFDLKKPVGQRVVHLTMLDGTPLTDRTYRLVTSNYRATGTGGYDAIRTCPVLWRGATEMPELVAEYIKKHSPIPVLHNYKMRVTMERFECAQMWIKHAGAMLQSMLESAHINFTKKTGHTDIVTDYDKQLEQYLRGEIGKAFPEDQIMGEEFPAVEMDPNCCTWYIDPIDGTTNFVSQRCNFAICVGCTIPSGRDFGLVFDVAGNLLYSAEVGGGAWMNDTRLRTSDTADISDVLFTSPSVTDMFLTKTSQSEKLARLALDVRAVRSLGSVALELCQVASGRMDVCIAIHSHPWDHNAARVILSEAGGAVRALAGGSLPYTAPSGFIAGNSEGLVTQISEDYL